MKHTGLSELHHSTRAKGVKSTNSSLRLNTEMLLAVHHLRRRKGLCFHPCLFVCAFIGPMPSSRLLKSYERILLKVFGREGRGRNIKWLDFGSDSDEEQIQKFLKDI